MANKDIREALKISGVRQWELADKMGYSCAWFSIKMRKELSQEEKEKCFALIQKIAEEKGGKA